MTPRQLQPPARSRSPQTRCREAPRLFREGLPVSWMILRGPPRRRHAAPQGDSGLRRHGPPKAPPMSMSKAPLKRPIEEVDLGLTQGDEEEYAVLRQICEEEQERQRAVAAAQASPQWSAARPPPAQPVAPVHVPKAPSTAAPPQAPLTPLPQRARVATARRGSSSSSGPAPGKGGN